MRVFPEQWQLTHSVWWLHFLGRAHDAIGSTMHACWKMYELHMFYLLHCSSGLIVYFTVCLSIIISLFMEGVRFFEAYNHQQIPKFLTLQIFRMPILCFSAKFYFVFRNPQKCLQLMYKICFIYLFHIADIKMNS